jgi:catechol 2,3-dioxygenase-like lactoylglutathione lyase family enzyme
MRIESFHTIVLQVSDLDASIAFYECALGGPFSRVSERAAQIHLGQLALLLHVDHEALPARRGAGIHIDFSVSDVRRHHADLAAKGLSPSGVSEKPWGMQFTLTDPDGYVLEFLGSARRVHRYMVIERFRDGDAQPVYARFQERGRLAPDGLRYVASWVDAELRCCYQVMETDAPELLERWMEQWRDLVDFEVHEVIGSDQAAARVSARAS